MSTKAAKTARQAIVLMKTPKARDSCAISAVATVSGHLGTVKPACSCACSRGSLYVIVGSLAGDDDVMNVGFAQTGI